MAGIIAKHGRNFNEHNNLIFFFAETLEAATGLVERTSASALLLLEHQPVDMLVVMECCNMLARFMPHYASIQGKHHDLPIFGQS